MGNALPQDDMVNWLEMKKANWVKHLDYDELMLLVRSEFELEHPDMTRFEKLTTIYLETFKSLTSKLEAKPDSPEKSVIERAIEKPDKEVKTWWSVVFEAHKYEKTDSEKANSIYLEGLQKFPDHANLLGYYAYFLHTIRKDYAMAEEYFQKSINVDANDATILGLYANFLKEIPKDYGKAEVYYQKAIAADPNLTINLCNYAILLKDIHKDYDKAEVYYKKALDIKPNHANYLGNYAGLLLSRGNFNEGEALLTKAIELADKDSLLLECLFYKYAHIEDSHQKGESLARIKDLIQSGARSPGWDLEDNVKRAIEDGHPHPEFLETLAKVISEEADAAELEKYEEWTKLS